MNKDEHAVSAVVSAVLLFALFSTAFLVWSVSTLPDWVGDREHNHARATSSGFSRLGAELDALSIGQDASLNVDLAPSRVPLLQIAQASGSLAVEPGFRFTAAFTGEEAFMIGSGMVADAENPMPSATAVASIRALQLEYVGPGTAQNGFGEITAFRDADGDGVLDDDESMAQARIGKRSGQDAVLCGQSEAYLELRTGTRGSPELIATHALACNPSNSATFSVNLMSADYRFAGLLGRLGDEFAITTRDVDAGTPRLAMVWTGTDGATRAAGTGVVLDMDLDLEGDRIVFGASYQEYPQSAITFEGGGVINTQAAGSAFAQAPVFAAVKAGGEGHLRWRLVDLSGSGAVTGTDAATLRLTKTSVTEFVVKFDAAGGASFGLDTSTPGAWQQLWTDARVLGGFDAADMATSTGAGTTSLMLGNIPWTVHMSVIHADVSVN